MLPGQRESRNSFSSALHARESAKLKASSTLQRLLMQIVVAREGVAGRAGQHMIAEDDGTDPELDKGDWTFSNVPLFSSLFLERDSSSVWPHMHRCLLCRFITAAKVWFILSTNVCSSSLLCSSAERQEFDLLH